MNAFFTVYLGACSFCLAILRNKKSCHSAKSASAARNFVGDAGDRWWKVVMFWSDLVGCTSAVVAEISILCRSRQDVPQSLAVGTTEC